MTVPVVDDMAALAVGVGAGAPQRQHLRRADPGSGSGARKAFQAVVIETHAQAMTDQARGGGGERASRRMKPPLDVTVTIVSS